MAPDAGRFAPSPSADLHIGNLRTAVLAWLFARSTGRRFLMRVDDLDDRTHADIANRQLDDLAAIGLTLGRGARMAIRASGPLRRGRSHELADRDLLYECYCSRRDIAQAPRAPHAPQGAYPGTCRELTDAEREIRRAETGPPAGAAAAHRRDRPYGARSAARRLHRHRRRLRGPSRRRRRGVQPRGGGRRRRRGHRSGGARRRPAAIVATAGLPGEAAGLSGADVRARRAGAQRGRGTAGQARRRRDARGDRRRSGRLRRSPSRWAGRASDLDELLAQFDPARLPRQPWIYRPD